MQILHNLPEYEFLRQLLSVTIVYIPPMKMSADTSVKGEAPAPELTPQHQRLIREFAEARRRTRDLLNPLSNEDLYRQHDPLMSPIAWDVGHIGNFEELWAVRALPGSGDVYPELDEMYDAVKNPRSVRDKLPLPSRQELDAYLDGIRTVVLGRLERESLVGDVHPLLQHGFVYDMLLQHEYQHNETILQTLQLKKGEPYTPVLAARELPPGDPDVKGMVTVPAGAFPMGTDQTEFAYDNERPQHMVHVEEYRIGIAPVSNEAFLEFVEDGGYQRREFWTDAGWHFITEHGLQAPKYWSRDDDGNWMTRTMSSVERLNPRRPVVHVCYHEAEAFCRYAGFRLPTEAEWEKAASWDAGNRRKLLYPWGDEPWTPERANLDVTGWGTAEIGAYPAGVSPAGCHQMIGDVWEWTSSDFTAYPGFRAFPYDEYSKIFFGNDYKVLRGGSWAVRPGAIRNTFRNWDFPIRRQIFSGFRLAADPE